MKTKIGLEIHLELKTKSKMFCSCKNDYNQEDDANTNICPICLGYPGTLPSVNRKAIEYAIMLSQALNCNINSSIQFYRKNYYYPDLPKGYQISQYKLGSVGYNGYLYTELYGGKKIAIDRVSLEEDTARSIQMENEVLLDFNRAGIPLIEIVTKPDMESSKEAVKFLENLRLTVQYLKISDANMEKGHMRVDINVSVENNERVEIKNVNSIREVENALEYEINYQIEEIKKGRRIKRTTKMWDDYLKITREMRRKESEEDYRYFPEPDIPSIDISEYRFLVKTPFDVYNELISLNVNREYAEIIVRDMRLCNYFYEFLENSGDAVVGSNLLVNILKSFDTLPSVREFAKLSFFMKENKIPPHIARQKLLEMKENLNVDEILKNIEVISESEIENIVKSLIERYPEKFFEYKSGKQGLIGFFIGEAKKINSKIDPKAFREVFEKISQNINLL
ncbi:MAG: Asp-tRNA(Asn)/Glu-tRNA(Gln) amidotransferase subunit GatB [candidate division WOR-3 bacterium]|nr:Asp-tRNA(Asn)/Glu-tRNA(Gln) amidotransferase subunit GatB [candidate division WOR-3 bacterium]MCX7947881.1 Asp-tRNA(Asn)/Glu-tRNA(Gln) amidotransferase subunit GatB [candidate division WOR-3 bacterium]MDW8150703.1 Asp-tRNA(Asn)/Glu-tRNA(Gln) amidotransferase subunit GatB [candidate division WOR-3 bacterium]